jgi:hypothetical protein
MNTSPPNSVKLAIGCLASSCVIALIQALVTHGFKPSGLAYEVIGMCLFAALTFLIYRRTNWARWIFAGCAIVWLASLALHVRFVADLTIVRGLLLLAQLIFWAGASFLLFLPSTNEWFRTHNERA